MSEEKTIVREIREAAFAYQDTQGELTTEENQYAAKDFREGAEWMLKRLFDNVPNPIQWVEEAKLDQVHHDKLIHAYQYLQAEVATLTEQLAEARKFIESFKNHYEFLEDRVDEINDWLDPAKEEQNKG